MMRQAGLAEFPDCTAARSAKHLRELSDMVAAGARAALVYVIQMQAERFDVARDIDPAYGAAFRAALAAGIESYAYICRITPDSVEIERQVPILAAAGPGPEPMGSARKGD